MKLNAENYFSKKAAMEYMSVSQFKSFSKCPAAAMAAIKGEYKREQTTALLVGSYVDSYFEGTLDSFKSQHTEIFKRDGTLKSDYIQAQSIIERIEQDKLFSEYLSGDKQVIMTGEINLVPVKIKIDSLLHDRIVDLKVMRDFEMSYNSERGRVPWFEAWGYDLQGAVYQEIVRQNIGKRLPFYLAAATKERVTDIEIVHIRQELLDVALEHFKSKVEMFDAIKNGVIEPEHCNRCDYCKMSKVLTGPTESNEFYLLA